VTIAPAHLHDDALVSGGLNKDSRQEAQHGGAAVGQLHIPRVLLLKAAVVATR
jgi:hypothetical protein